MIVLAALLALLALLFLDFLFYEWILHHKPNRRIGDTDGEILFFDPWLALRRWYGRE